MENKKIIWNNAMTYGVILGLVLILFSVIGYVFDKQDSPVLSILNYSAMAIIVYLGSKNLRDKYSGGYIKYGRALGSSFLIGFFGGILLAFYIYILMKYIDPSILEKMKILTEQKLNEKGLPESQIDLSMKMLSPGMITFGTVFTFSFWSFLVALIIAFFIRKENNTSIEGGESA